MVKDRVLDRCGLGLIMDDVGVGVVETSVVCIKMATRRNNKNINFVAFDETQLKIYEYIYHS